MGPDDFDYENDFEDAAQHESLGSLGDSQE